MNEVSYVLIRFVVIFLNVLSLAMLVRAVLSWFMQDGENAIVNFLYVMTEPIVMPLRLLCNALNWFQGVPIDMPYLITMIILSISSTLLSGMVG